MSDMQDRGLAYVAKGLEEAMESLRSISLEGIPVAVYAKALDARMSLAGAQAALEGLRLYLEGKR